jgi:hypothetical protein
MYERGIITETFTLKRDCNDIFQLYDKNNEEMGENWDFGTVLDNNYTFEIVEEVKIPDEVKNALKVLSNYCDGRSCEDCVFVDNFLDCKLQEHTPDEYYYICLRGGEDE